MADLARYRPFLDPPAFARLGGLRLRGYQQAVARAIVDSVLQRRGESFAVLFPRQSGKNELQAQIEALLLLAFSLRGGEIVKISPTWRPQSLNAMRRLERVLEAHPATRGRWEKENGYIYRINRARIFFLSGAPEANIVGATASLLLEVDEAQDVTLAKYDKEIAPMAASTNATRVFWGTAWTSQTLLAREVRAAQAAEIRDPAGGRRAFVLSADSVAAEVPAYGQFVAAQVARLGRQNPLVRTQFYSEEIDGQAGMFPAERIARMRGEHPAGRDPRPGRHYALLVDVGGESAEVSSTPGTAAHLTQPGLCQARLFPGTEMTTDGATATTTDKATDKPAAAPASPADLLHGYTQEKREHDATALTVVEVDLTSAEATACRAPVYRVMARQTWRGVSQVKLYEQIRALAEHWRASRLVVDATGVGAGLAAFLARALPNKVTSFVFSSASKSRLGWDFLALVDAGRWRDYADAPGQLELFDPASPKALQTEFFQQLSCCTCDILPGPGRRMQWGVPDGTRDPATGQPVHDDLVISAALAAVLDGLDWPAPGSGKMAVVRRKDPLDEMLGF